MDNPNCIYYDMENKRCLHPYCGSLACAVCASAITEPVLKDCTSFVNGKCRRKLDECILFGKGPDGRCAFCKHYHRRGEVQLEHDLRRSRAKPVKKRKRKYVKRAKG